MHIVCKIKETVIVNNNVTYIAVFCLTDGVRYEKYIKFLKITLSQTIALCGTALFLVLISFTGSYHSALICMALAVSCCGFHNSGILVNPQDIAPRHAGAVFGKLRY